MKSTVKNLNKTKVKIKFEVPKESVASSFAEAYKKVRKKANIKGFRQGKVPDAILNKYHKADIDMESLNDLVSKTYSKALQEHNLSPVLQPKFNVLPLENGKNYSYDVEIEVKPSFELSEYKEIPIKKLDAKIEDQEINIELQRIQDSKAELIPVEKDKPLTKGLVATIDFEGTIDGQTFSGSSAKGYAFEYGKGHFLKDFDDNLEGMVQGKEKLFEVHFPKDYPEEKVRDKKAQFRVTLQALHSKSLPPLDDEFAKDLGKKDLETVKNEIKDMLTKRKEREFRNQYAKEAIDFLVKKNNFDVPEGLIEAELKHSSKEKMDKKEIEKNIRLQFILEEIAKKESVKVEPQDIDKRFYQLAMMYRQPFDVIKKHYQENQLIPQLITQIAMEKTLDFVIDNATLK